MIGKIKKLKNQSEYVYPITVAEGVYVESNKHLKTKLQEMDTAIEQAAQTGGGTTEVSVTGRGHTLLALRGATINLKKNTDDNTVLYSFPTLDTDRYRRMFVWTAGAVKKWIDIPDGTLLDNDALVYNVSSNTLSTKNGTWGNVAVSADEILLMYNTLGRISGELSQYCVYGDDSLSIPVREIESEMFSNSGSAQGIFLIGDNIFKCAHSNDTHTDFANITVVSKTNPDVIIKTISHNFGHLNAPSYSTIKDSLIVGNGSKDYALLPKGWILPNFSTLTQGTTIDYNSVDKIELDFSQLTGEYKGQLCWGYDSTDIVYLFTNDNRILRKISLNKDINNRYDGTYTILKTWRSRTSDITGGMMFYKGFIYTGVKGEYGIRKCIPLNNGYFDSEYIPLVDKTGDMQGIAIDNSFCYAFSDMKGYKFKIEHL